MARHISQEVTDLIDDPQGSGPHRLVFVVEEEELDTLTERAEEYGIPIQARIEPSILVVELSDGQIEEFCRPSYIKSVSFDEGMKVLDAGNASLPPA